MSQFVHLHLHTDYSLLDGACDVEKLCQRVQELGMPAVAMTDHGNIFGAVHFVNAAHKPGVKPIVGCELYVCKKEDHHGGVAHPSRTFQATHSRSGLKIPTLTSQRTRR